MKKMIILIVLLCGVVFVQADENDDLIASQYIDNQFLITKSTKSYKEAKKFAQELAQKTGIKLDLRDLHYHKDERLSFPKKICEEESYEYPCYYPRGRGNDGVYISIEHSDNYEGFTKGYYIVLAASGDESKKMLKRVKSVVKDAYVKTSKVYMGCLH